MILIALRMLGIPRVLRSWKLSACLIFVMGVHMTDAGLVLYGVNPLRPRGEEAVSAGPARQEMNDSNHQKTSLSHPSNAARLTFLLSD